MLLSRRFIAVCTTTLVAAGMAACFADSGPTEAASAPPRFAPFAGSARAYANQQSAASHFFFLPPLGEAVSSKGSGTAFDPSLDPVVEICQLSNGACSRPLVAVFTSAGKGPEAVRISNEAYSVDWNTPRVGIDVASLYRITVKVVNTELGHTDISFHTGAAGSSSVASFQAGQTVPIRVRIEKGAVGVVPPSGGTAVLNGGQVSLTFPAGAVTSPIAVTATPVAPGTPAAPDASVLAGTQYDFQPSPTTFAQPVMLTLSYPTVLPPNLKAARLAVCKLIDEACVPLPGSVVNVAARTVTAPVSGFSSYAVTRFPAMLYSDGAGASFMHTPAGEVPVPGGATATGWYLIHDSWSLDGLRFVYSTGNGYAGNPPGPADLHVVNTDGTGDRVLFANPAGASDADCPRWSNDGTSILYHADGYNGYGTPFLINPDGSGKHRLVDPASWSFEGCPERWLPDSRHVGLRGTHDGISAIWVINADGTGLQKVVETNRQHDFAWSADGTQIAFYADWAGTTNIGGGLYTINADGTNLKFIEPAVIEFAWSPVAGDNRLCFLAEVDGYYGDKFTGIPGGIYLVNSDGSGLRALHIPSGPAWYYTTGWQAHLSWSPDASAVAFDSEGDIGPLYSTTTYIVNTDGSGLQPLLPVNRATNAIWQK